jgi:endonuclease/exonuclease/phosphatase family metal-dependent hydrolase
MKIVTLNTWGGRVLEPLLQFLKSHNEVDVFCLQEITNNFPLERIQDQSNPPHLDILTVLKKALPDHISYFRPNVEDVYGNVIFVRQGLEVVGEGEIFVHRNEQFDDGRTGHHSRNLQWVEVKVGNKIISVLNIHGLWNGQGKTDTPERLAQSAKILEFLGTIQTPVVLCGDFNLLPETESLKMLEGKLVNLVKEYKVTSTRTSYYSKPDKFADYILISPELAVKDFKVLPDEVSDHSPLFVECD